MSRPFLIQAPLPTRCYMMSFIVPPPVYKRGGGTCKLLRMIIRFL